MLAAVGWCAIVAGPVRAQIVRGVVVEQDTRTPVEGAMVVLTEPDGRVVHRVLTDARGGFIADADRPGPHRIRVDRIGYESLTTDLFDVPVQGVYREIAVPIRPVELTGLDVEGSRRCALPREQGRATARVWEEARKALEAAAWTLSSGTYRYTLLQFVRKLDADGRRVVSEKRRFVRSTAQAPYVSAPAAELVRDGFIRENSDGTITYFAPDAEAFLSDAFLETHCMRVGDVRDGMVGLSFEPVHGRRETEIRGTLWIEAATATLRRLEFRYVNRPPDRDMGMADGQVVFGRLPNGTWVVREWSLRLPVLAAPANRSRTFVMGYEVQGGAVWRAVDRTGTTVVEATSATVSGTLVDSLGAGAVTGAVVRSADQTEENADVRTGVAGSFTLTGLAPGAPVLEVHHPSLDTLGLGPASFPVEAEAGEITNVRLRLPGVGEILGAACGDAFVAEGSAIILGRVLLGAEPAAGAQVRVRWSGGAVGDLDASTLAAPPRPTADPPRWRLDPEDARSLLATLDDRGIFLVCGVPRGSLLVVTASLGAEESAERRIVVPADDDVVTVTIPIERGR
jgi:hypothetical protein